MGQTFLSAGTLPLYCLTMAAYFLNSFWGRREPEQRLPSLPHCWIDKKDTALRGSWLHPKGVCKESWGGQNNIAVGRLITAWNQSKKMLYATALLTKLYKRREKGRDWGILREKTPGTGEAGQRHTCHSQTLSVGDKRLPPDSKHTGGRRTAWLPSC